MVRFFIRSLIFFGLCLGLLEISLFRLYKMAIFNTDSPQLIIVLGGDVDREHVGVRLAKQLSLPLVVTGGSNPEYANWLIQNSGISRDNIRFDYQAKDTFGNFTSLVDELSIEGIRHVLLITSQDHIERAMAVGWVIAGSRGIHLTGFSVPCVPFCQEEKLRKKWFDVIRSFVWVFTGKDVKIILGLKWPSLFSEV